MQSKEDKEKERLRLLRHIGQQIRQFPDPEPHIPGRQYPGQPSTSQQYPGQPSTSQQYQGEYSGGWSGAGTSRQDSGGIGQIPDPPPLAPIGEQRDEEDEEEEVLPGRAFIQNMYRLRQHHLEQGNMLEKQVMRLHNRGYPRVMDQGRYQFVPPRRPPQQGQPPRRFLFPKRTRTLSQITADYRNRRRRSDFQRFGQFGGMSTPGKTPTTRKGRQLLDRSKQIMRNVRTDRERERRLQRKKQKALDWRAMRGRKVYGKSQYKIYDTGMNKVKNLMKDRRQMALSGERFGPVSVPQLPPVTRIPRYIPAVFEATEPPNTGPQYFPTEFRGYSSRPKRQTTEPESESVKGFKRKLSETEFTDSDTDSDSYDSEYISSDSDPEDAETETEWESD